jgi:phage/plasmid-associated DNA primase
MAVDGAGEYLRDGLQSCAEVDAATAAYRSDEDSIGQFLVECCEVGNYNCPKASMRTAIEAWWKAEGKMRAPTNQTLKADFAKRGIVTGRLHGEPYHWAGVRLNAATSAEIARGGDDRWV